MENTQLNDIRQSSHLTASSEAALSHSNELDGLRLSPHFKLSEFLNLQKHPDNLPTPQVVFNLKYGCQYLLDALRLPTPLCQIWVLQITRKNFPLIVIK